MKICAIYNDYWACSYFRVIEPFTKLNQKLQLRKDGSKADVYFLNQLFDQQGQAKLDILNQYDIISFQRVIDPLVVETMKTLKKNGKIILHEIDDNLLKVEPTNPAYKFYQRGGVPYKNFIEACKVCDYMTVTTDYLKNVYHKELSIDSDKIVVFENAMDFDHPQFKFNLNRRNELPLDKVVIGWFGGSSHLNDLESLIEPIKQTLIKHPQTIFAFCSDPQMFILTFYRTQWFQENKDRWIIIPPEQGFFVRYKNIMSMCDIGLAVVSKSEFNKSKSFLKIMEYGMWKIPTIATNLECYTDFLNYGENMKDVVISDNFTKSLDQLIENETLRKQIGENCYNIIRAKLDVDLINLKRQKFFEEILK